MKKRIVTISGASGVGKSTIIKAELNWASHAAMLILSTTTRKPRETSPDLPGEYEYVTRENFSLAEEEDTFAWVVEVAGNKYGTKKVTLDAVLGQDKKIGLMTITPGLLPLLKTYAAGAVYSFYVLLPDESEHERRMRARGDSPETIATRLSERKTMDARALQNNGGMIDEYITTGSSLAGPESRVLEKILECVRKN